MTVDKHTHELARPFIVLATQNPVEYEGTYPLPEAQLDRFMVRVSLGYPTAEQETEMLADHAERDRVLDLEPVADVGERAGRSGGGRRGARQRGAAPLHRGHPRRHARRPARGARREPARRPDAVQGREGQRRARRARPRAARTTSRRSPARCSPTGCCSRPGTGADERAAVVRDALERVPAL